VSFEELRQTSSIFGQFRKFSPPQNRPFIYLCLAPSTDRQQPQPARPSIKLFITPLSHSLDNRLFRFCAEQNSFQDEQALPLMKGDLCLTPLSSPPFFELRIVAVFIFKYTGSNYTIFQFV
jgi:hypothetical protein